MMNKYQEALEFLRSEDVTAWGNDKLEILYFHLDNIEELVEKATPKKPEIKELIRKDNYRDGTNIPRYDWWCPNCHLEHISGNDINYCPTCGQAIDWSNE